MALGPGELMNIVGSYLGPVFGIIGFIIQILLILGVLFWFYTLWQYNVKLIISELGKNRKVLNRETRAREFIDKKTKTPKLKTFGILGFGGEVIPKPPAECITPFKSRVTNKVYHFVFKDGLYWPIQNLVLGKVTELENGQIAYSLDGSGLEINRDFNAEDAILNRLESAALKYRNKDQRNQMYLSYGLMILSFIIAGVIMIYTVNKIGGLNTAIAQLKEPIMEGVQNAVASKIGPG